MSCPCIILGGGLGLRLRSAVPDRPKSLAPVGRRTFLEVQLESLTTQGVSEFILSLGYLADQVLHEAHRLQSRYSIRTIVERSPLGTGGAIVFAMRTFELSEALVTNGDTFLGGSLDAMHRPLSTESGELVRMAVISVGDRTRYGGVHIEDHRAISFLEKGCAGPGLINAGFYRVTASIFGNLAAETPLSFESALLPQLAAAGHLYTARLDGEFMDIGVPEDYQEFCRQHG